MNVTAMHTYERDGAFLVCPVCGRRVLPVGENPLKWWVDVLGDAGVAHTIFEQGIQEVELS